MKTRGLKRLFLLLVCMLLMAPGGGTPVSAAEFDGGNGSAGSPYRVSTPEQLNRVRDYPDAYFIQTADIDMTEETAEGGLFDNNGAGWTPIPDFSGQYDGGGNRIIGLRINSDEKIAGLFGTNTGTVQNLGMDGGAVASSASSLTKDVHIGGIVGYNHGGSIKNCYNTNSVQGFRDVGGIAGCIDDGVIENCYNIGSVYATGESGGIAGLISDVGTIENCYNVGIVSEHSGFGFNGIASISGWDYTITNCYFYAEERTAGEGTPLSMEELKQQESYAGFDFDTVWTMDESGDYLFPILQGVTPQCQDENTTDFAGGTGRLENPYQISTPEQLNNVRNYPNAYFVQTTDIDMAEETSGSGWEEIQDFNGCYDGGGNRIIGLQAPNGFIDTNNGIIRNLGMEGALLLHQEDWRIRMKAS